MKALLLSHKFLHHNIMIIMDGEEGTSIDTETGYQTSWVDDNGENEIENIALSWLEWQIYIHVSISNSRPPEFTGHYWWNRELEATTDERIAEIPNMIKEIY